MRSAVACQIIICHMYIYVSIVCLYNDCSSRMTSNKVPQCVAHHVACNFVVDIALHCRFKFCVELKSQLTYYEYIYCYPLPASPPNHLTTKPPHHLTSAKAPAKAPATETKLRSEISQRHSWSVGGEGSDFWSLNVDLALGTGCWMQQQS